MLAGDLNCSTYQDIMTVFTLEVSDVRRSSIYVHE